MARKRHFRYVPLLRFDNSIKKTAMMAVPVFMGSTALPINQFIGKIFASRLEEESVAALNYSVLIIGMTTMILSTIIFPKLTRANSLEQHDRFNGMVNLGVTLIILFALPCSLGSMLYSCLSRIPYENIFFHARRQSS